MQNLTLTNYSKARAQLLVQNPFYASLVLSTQWNVNENIPTAQTDYTTIEYNPAFLEPMPVPQIIFVMIHEVRHIIGEHNQRMRSRKPKRWNHSCDYAINQELVDSGLTMPVDPKTGGPGGLINPKYQGMTPEQIYDIRTKEKGKGGKKGQQVGKGGNATEPEDDDDEPNNMIGMDLSGNKGKDGKDKDLTPQQEKDISDKIKGMVAQAATMARIAGKLPADLEILVDGIINPPQPWEVILREFMQRMVETTETWSRRNRRFTTVLPTRFAIGMGELVIIGDTSASMLGDKIWAQLAAEINYCIEYVKPSSTRVIWADARSKNHEQVFEPGEEVKLEPRGGGGTDMRLPLAYVEKYEPCCVILVTDCQTPWPKQPTPYPLIVASTTKDSCPDWALRLQLR